MANPELSELVATIAHDLRTPLTSIRGFADVLVISEDRLTSAQRLDYLERIRTAAELLEAMITELSALARDASGTSA